MALPLRSISIHTITGETFKGFAKPPSEVDEQWDAVKDFSCDFLDETYGYIEPVKSFRLHPSAQAMLSKTIQKTPATKKTNAEDDPIYSIRWDRLKQKGICRIFLRNLAGSLGMVALKSQIMAATRLALNKTANHLGIKHRAILPEFTGEELMSQRLNPQGLANLRLRFPIYPPQLPCFQFALLSARDPKALKTMFESFDLVGEKGFGVLPVAIPLLRHLAAHYRAIDTFEPGDLVLYLKDGIPKHLAYCRENGYLESKFGYCKDVHIHQLDNAGAEHSNQVIFFRKKSSEPKSESK